MDGPFGLDGSIRTIGIVIDPYAFEPIFEGDDIEGLSQSLLRLTAGGRPNDRLKYEVHLVQGFTYFSMETGFQVLPFLTESGKLKYRAVDDTWDQVSENDHGSSLWWDRFNVKIALPWMDITLGRQAVTFGKAYFWNPLDIFLPFDSSQFDRDYKAGVDAVRMDVPLGDLSGVTLVYAFGRELDLEGRYLDRDLSADTSWYGSALLGRAFTYFKGFDFALQGGKVYGGHQLGGGLVGEVKTIELRAEAAHFWDDPSPAMPFPLNGRLLEDALTAVIGVGRRFENSLTFELEWLYNGAGESDSDRFFQALLRASQGHLLQLGRWMVGMNVSYEITPLILGQLVAIHSLTDQSTQIQPFLSWSLSDNADLLAGAIFSIGERPALDPVRLVRIRSEFGTYPHFYFAEIKYYF